jgi:hypothetical protein
MRLNVEFEAHYNSYNSRSRITLLFFTYKGCLSFCFESQKKMLMSTSYVEVHLIHISTHSLYQVLQVVKHNYCVQTVSMT